MLDLPRHYLTHRWRRNHASSPPSRINNMCPGTSTSLTPWQYGQKAMIPCQHPPSLSPRTLPSARLVETCSKGQRRSRGATAADLSQFPFATGPGSRGLLLSDRSRIIDWLAVRISDESDVHTRLPATDMRSGGGEGLRRDRRFLLPKFPLCYRKYEWLFPIDL